MLLKVLGQLFLTVVAMACPSKTTTPSPKQVILGVPQNNTGLVTGLQAVVRQMTIIISNSTGFLFFFGTYLFARPGLLTIPFSVLSQRCDYPISLTEYYPTYTPCYDWYYYDAASGRCMRKLGYAACGYNAFFTGKECYDACVIKEEPGFDFLN